MPLVNWNSPEYGSVNELGTPGEPVYEFRPEDYLDNLQAYNLNEGVDSQLALSRLLYQGSAYIPVLRAFPNTATDLMFTARQTKQTTINVPPGSYLVSITGTAYTDPDDFGTIDVSRLAFNLYDRGAHVSLVQGAMANAANLAPNLVNNGLNMPIGVYYPLSPLVILHPGQVTIEMTSMYDNVLYAQLCLQFAYPNTGENVNVVQQGG